ncbi:DsrE family protein [Algoriphagus formosus]|uniref:DsrE family protein n=1 Tax=Algoriphagus formosus TaxID=2007308 RepID=UPI003F70DB83
MKKSLWCILVIALTFTVNEASFGQTVLDQETITDLNKSPNYVFGVKDEDGLKSALSVYYTFMENGVQIENFEIVVKGPVVRTMVKESELEKYFEKYKGKVRVSICSIAMKRLGVSKEQLFPGLDVVETYTIRILQLQALGYNSMSY